MKSFRENRFFFMLKNLLLLFRCDVYKELMELKCSQSVCKENLRILKRNLYDLENRELAFEIKAYYNNHSDLKSLYEEELCFIYENGLEIFPYKKLKSVQNVISGYDENRQMPWVLHNKNKLYFPSIYSRNKAMEIYKNFIETECILGGGTE